MAEVDLAVIGAGVVGLAIARRLAASHRGLLILERRARHGTETSSRNSEVVHAGIYYEPGSLKARLCVEGHRMLRELCVRHALPHRWLGKLIVAVAPEEISTLERLLAVGSENGASLRLVSGATARGMEPAVPALAALESPDTGIVSADALMDFFLRSAEMDGATLSLGSEVVGLARATRDWEIAVRTPEGTETFTAERVVNAAGLGADEVAALAGIDLDAAGYRLHYCKGAYFAAPRWKDRISRLVYPTPDAASLGVHVVLDLAGRLRFGPDVEPLAGRTLDYRVDPGRRAAFAAAAARLLPGIREEDLVPDTAGIRPRLQAPGGAPRDFVIADEAGRGLPGLIDLIGIESPGLTAALAIAEHVAHLLGER